MVFFDGMPGFDLVKTFFEGLDALRGCLKKINFYVKFVYVLCTKDFVFQFLNVTFFSFFDLPHLGKIDC